MTLIGITNSCTPINNYPTFLPYFNLNLQSPLSPLKQNAEAFTHVDDPRGNV